MPNRRWHNSTDDSGRELARPSLIGWRPKVIRELGGWTALWPAGFALGIFGRGSGLFFGKLGFEPAYAADISERGLAALAARFERGGVPGRLPAIQVGEEEIALGSRHPALQEIKGFLEGVARGTSRKRALGFERHDVLDFAVGADLVGFEAVEGL